MRVTRRVRNALGITSLQQYLERIEEALADPNHPAVDTIGRIEYLTTLANTGAHPRRYRGPDQAVQQLLRLQYRDLIDAGRPLPPLGDIEMRFYSQNGEDGIILLLLEAVGTATKRSVEICAGDGIECNTSYFAHQPRMDRASSRWRRGVAHQRQAIRPVGHRGFHVSPDATTSVGHC